MDRDISTWLSVRFRSRGSRHATLPPRPAFGRIGTDDGANSAETPGDRGVVRGGRGKGTTGKRARRSDWLARECRLYRQGAGCAWLWVVGIALATALPVYLLTARSFSAAAATGVAVVLVVSLAAARVTGRRR